jgi:ABC-type amino acid transport system permease subunit
VVALFYFALCWPLSLLSQRMEARVGRGQTPAMAVQA